MKMNVDNNQNYAQLHNNIVHRDKLEKRATAAVTSEILTKLNISIETLPQKCQHLLQQVTDNQSALEIDKLDSAAIGLRLSRELSEKLEEEYEILKLKQKNAELQTKIDRNNKFLEDLRKELVYAKDSLASQNPNPDNISDYIRKLKQKVGSYEESCDKAKLKFSKLSVPESILPMSLAAQRAASEALQRDADALRQRADDVALARRAREAFSRLRK